MTAARVATAGGEPGAEQRIAAEVVALNMGFQPEVGLARALGVAASLRRCRARPSRDRDRRGGPHRDRRRVRGWRRRGAGRLARGDGARPAGRAGRGAGPGVRRAARSGRRAPALARALAFQDALWRAVPPPAPRLDLLRDDTIVCRCEEVTAGRLRAEIAGGLTSLAALKKATRAGMGRCQGRFCAATVARLCPDSPAEPGFAAPRAPLRPVPAAALMFEAPEFEALLHEQAGRAGASASGAAGRRRDPARRRAGDRRRRGGAVLRLFPGGRGGRRAAGRPRRGGDGGQHRQCRQPACAAAVLRLRRTTCPRMAARRR